MIELRDELNLNIGRSKRRNDEAIMIIVTF